MQLKRLYDPESIAKRRPFRERLDEIEKQVSARETLALAPIPELEAEAEHLKVTMPAAVVTGIRVQKATRIHKFSPAAIQGGQDEGWMTVEKAKVTIHAEAGDVVYHIVATPGLFCCHCNYKFSNGREALAHIQAKHKGKKSPDPQNPSGYRGDNFFRCVLVGDEINELTPEQAKELAQANLDAFALKLQKKYGDTRLAAEKRNAAKPTATVEG